MNRKVSMLSGLTILALVLLASTSLAATASASSSYNYRLTPMKVHVCLDCGQFFNIGTNNPATMNITITIYEPNGSVFYATWTEQPPKTIGCESLFMIPGTWHLVVVFKLLNGHVLASRTSTIHVS